MWHCLQILDHVLVPKSLSFIALGIDEGRARKRMREREGEGKR